MQSSQFRCLVCAAVYDRHVPFCTGCWEYGTVLLVGGRPHAQIDHVPEVVTARDLARSAWSRVEVPAYPALTLGTGALVLLVGPSGAGKSTMLCRAMDSLRGPVVLESLEEAPGPSLAARLARVHVKRADFQIVGRASVDQLVEIATKTRAVALGIDSAQLSSFAADELRHMAIVISGLNTLWCTSQVNKQGRVAGREELVHEADVVIEIEDMRWQLTKSRYQPVDGIEGSVLTEVPDVAA